MALNQQTLEGNWNEIKGKLHERWGQLTQDDLQKARGNVDQLVGLIQRKTGEARERVEQYLNELTAGSGSGVSRMADAVRGYASSAVESMRGYGSTAAGSAEEARARAAEMLRGGYAQTERMVQQRPLESLAVGFGAGLITGVIIGLVMRSSSRY
ncbi:MAG TPA: CsbD family protein [Lacipirellula sp.]